MASWIVHLRIAENLLQQIPGLDPSLFATGSIAPDSGIPDEKWENFTPPPEVTHFFDNETDLLYRTKDLEFYRRYMANRVASQADIERFSFLLGYFLHLVTDNLWAVRIGRPTQQRFTTQFAADKDFIWEVKKDWYGLDFIYVRDHPDSLFWRVFVHCQFDRDYLDFLPVEAVRQRLAYIQGYYQKNDESIQALYRRPYIYLSKGEMDHFVEYASKSLFNIYQLLWIEQRNPGEGGSALELISPEKE